MKISKRLVRRLEAQLAPAVCPVCKGIGACGVVVVDGATGREERPRNRCARCGMMGPHTRIILQRTPEAEAHSGVGA